MNIKIIFFDFFISFLRNLNKVDILLYVETVNTFGAESHPNWRGG